MNIFEREFARETIFLDRNIITTHYTPKILPFRDKYIEQISSILSESIRGKKSDNVFIYGKTGCIAGDSLVYTSNGWKKIRDVDMLTDLVATFNKKIKKYEWSDFVFLKYKNNDKLLKITLENGYELTVTRDHPLLTSDMEWKKSNQLKIADELALGYDLPSLNDHEMPLALARLLGFTLSDGSLNRKQKKAKDGRGYYYNADRQRYRYFSIDANLLKKVQEDLAKVFGGTPSIIYPKDRCAHVNMISQNACQTLNSLGVPFGEKSRIIEVPESILQASPTIQREFLKALFSGDGTVSQQTFQIEYYSNSKKFLQQVAYILYQEGIRCKVRSKPAKLNGKIFDAYRLYIQGQENIFKFYNKIGFYSTVKQERLRIMITKYVKTMPINETGFSASKIAKIEEAFEDFVYDLTVPKNHNFIANGIISHNTGKTSVTKHVMQQLLDFAISKNMPIEGNYVNCRNHNSKYRILIKIVKELYPEENFLGFSAAFIYEKLVDYARRGKQLILVLDEVDKVKDLDELIYGLTRANDEIKDGGISIIGISNNVMFKDRLDPRTKSSLCEHELVFPPYNAQELTEIIKQRVQSAFRPNTIEESAIHLAAAVAAQESGDARTAVMLMLRAGEIADKKSLGKVTDAEVKKAKKTVEEEIIFNMVSTRPKQQQLVLYAIAALALNKKPMQKITGESEEGVLFSGEIYDEYCRISKKFKETTVSARWYREYISELEMYGLIHSTNSGKGIKGQTRLIKLGFDAEKIRSLIEKEIAEKAA